MKLIYMRETLLKMTETFPEEHIEAILSSGVLKEAGGLVYLVIETE